jgi:hypothetical protein
MNNYHDTEEQALVAAEAYAEKVGHVEFEGMNCNDWLDDDAPECEGWDGIDRRCDCGNRRVNWMTSQLPNGKWTAYAVAY